MDWGRGHGSECGSVDCRVNWSLRPRSILLSGINAMTPSTFWTVRKSLVLYHAVHVASGCALLSCWRVRRSWATPAGHQLRLQPNGRADVRVQAGEVSQPPSSHCRHALLHGHSASILLRHSIRQPCRHAWFHSRLPRRPRPGRMLGCPHHSDSHA